MRIPKRSALESISKIEHSVKPPPSVSAVTLARSIAYLIENHRFPMPFVFPTEIGGIQFEWKGSARELNLEILPEIDRLAFLKILNGSPLVEGEITNNVEQEVYRLIDWMLSA